MLYFNLLKHVVVSFIFKQLKQQMIMIYLISNETHLYMMLTMNLLSSYSKV